MTAQDPVHQIETDCGAEFMSFGPPPEEGGAQIVASFGAYEAEYAAVRQRVGIMHMAQRGVLRVTGGDRAEFLHNMLTCKVKGFAAGSTRRAFQLNAKGRIVADVMLHHGDADTWLETDVLDLEPLRELLEGRLFAEDVRVEDFSDQRVKLVLHGPASVALLQRLADDADASQGPEAVERLGQAIGTHHVVSVAGEPVSAYRHDDAGAVGLHLLVPTDGAGAIYEKLLDAAGFDARADAAPDADYAQRRRESLRGRPIGWLAYNTARIEAGTPIFHVDFGRDSLPAETGVIDQAVDFDKGCYIGQEIVARIHNLGHPKRVLVGLRFDDERLPVAGAQVMRAGDGEPGADAEVIGGVTSSTLSPLLGQCAIAFAVMKWGMHEPGTQVRVAADDTITTGRVHALRFLGAT